MSRTHSRNGTDRYFLKEYINGFHCPLLASSLMVSGQSPEDYPQPFAGVATNPPRLRVSTPISCGDQITSRFIPLVIASQSFHSNRGESSRLTAATDETRSILTQVRYPASRESAMQPYGANDCPSSNPVSSGSMTLHCSPRVSLSPARCTASTGPKGGGIVTLDAYFLRLLARLVSSSQRLWQ